MGGFFVGENMSAENLNSITEVKFADQTCFEIYEDGVGGGQGYRKPKRMLSVEELMCSAHVQVPEPLRPFIPTDLIHYEEFSGKYLAPAVIVNALVAYLADTV